MEVLATLSRFAQTVSGCLLTGWMVFRLLGAHPQRQSHRRAAEAGLALCFIFAGIASLAFQTVLVTGSAGALLDFPAWRGVMQHTVFGYVWLGRESLMLALGLMCWYRLPTVFLVALAGAATALGAASGHAAALEPAWPALVAQGVHIAAIGVWWGGLIPLALAMRAGNASEFALTFRRFSRLAATAMVLIIGTGVFLSLAHVATWPALFGTAYGQRLLFKLFLIAVTLLLAARLRWHWLRHLEQIATERIATWGAWLVLAEFLVALAVILIGSILSSTPPARHEQILWPFGFRFAPEVTWAQPQVPLQVIAGSVLVLTSVAKFFWSYRQGWQSSLVSGFLLLLGLLVALPPLGVQAFPDTYRGSAVAYHSISIGNGAKLFQQHCANCHGEGGQGNGPLAAALPRPPADLTAPHTADHTAGDMFWWLTHGIPAGKMPGFGEILSEDERWDLINFLRAFSSGFQARIIRPRIASMRPWLGAPDFNYVLQSGENGALKEFRGDKPVVLVFFSLPDSSQRLAQWRHSRVAIEAAGAKLLMVPLAPGSHEQDHLLPVMSQGAEEVSGTYLLLSRTLNNPRERAALPHHVEMLVDRFGYLRARWFPREGDDWVDMEKLAGQIRALNAEPEILPPPDEHLH
ncbi:MAG: c-type cytochrome [Betaproteobacteria bacterium]|nr:c-type cytochrome [Betaproteobacteria bacterium]